MTTAVQVPLRSICRSLGQDCLVGGVLGRRRSMMSSMDSSNYMSDFDRSMSSTGSSSHGSDTSSSLEEDNTVYETIDDLMDLLVVDATKRYAGTNNVLKVNKRTVWSPERTTIDLAVKRLTVEHLSINGVEAGKSYYELRILASGSEHYACYDNDAITSVLIGYAALNGIDNGFHSRRFTFQDSQHLYKFCEVLGEKGRFEDAAF